MSQENLELVKKIYEDFGQGNIPAVLAQFSNDCEWHMPAGHKWGRVYRGPQDIGSFFMALGQGYEEFAVVPDEFISVDKRVFVLGKLQGKGRATGKTLNGAPFVHILTVENGKVTRFNEYSDTATENAALG